MFKTPAIAMVLVAVAAVLGAAGQFLFKHASGQIKGGIVSFFLNPWVIAGMVCYVTVMGLFTTAFKKGGTVTVLYPIYASTFIWAAIIAWQFHDQPIRLVHVAGMAFLVAGMFLMGL